MVGPSWLLVPVNALGSLGRSKYRSLPQSARVQDNLEEVHAIIWLMCEIPQEMSGGFLILCFL